MIELHEWCLGFTRISDPASRARIHDLWPEWHFRRAGEGISWLSEPPSFHSIEIPLWIVLVLMSLPTCLAWWGWARARWRARIGKCRGCGYDLAGISTGVCPECGKAVA
jgi:hypothetical protein